LGEKYGGEEGSAWTNKEKVGKGEEKISILLELGERTKILSGVARGYGH